MKKLTTILAFIIATSPTILSAQDVINISGVNVYITEGMYVGVLDMDLNISNNNGNEANVYSAGHIDLFEDLNINTTSNPFHPYQGQNGTLAFVGNITQNISGSITPELQNLLIDKPGGDLNLNTPLVISGVLSLVNGIIYNTEDNVLTMAENATWNSAGAASHINGYMAKVADIGDAFLFPLGSNNYYRPIAFNNLDGAATITASHNHIGGGWIDDPQVEGNEVNGVVIDKVSNVESWTMEPDSDVEARVFLTWDDDYSEVPDTDGLIVALWNDVDLEWINLGVNSISYVQNLFDSYDVTDMFGMFRLATSKLAPLMGDVNDDGVVNVLDVVITVNYITDPENPPPGFNFENADIDGDGVITTADLTAIIQIILGTYDPKFSIISDIAYMTLQEDGNVTLDSDGTLTALLFEIKADNLSEVTVESLLYSDHNIAFNNNTGLGIIYSMTNSTFGKGEIDLMQIKNIDASDITWGKAEAANIANNLVNVITYSPCDGTFIADLTYDDAFSVYPNPNRGNFILKIDMPENAVLSVDIVDERSRIVHEIPRKEFNKGQQSLEFNISSDVNSGVYFLRIQEGANIKYKQKIIIVE